EFSRDLWNDFTLDGGVRWNSESKDLHMKILTGFNNGTCFTPSGDTISCRKQREQNPTFFSPTETWSAPTGTLRLAYRLAEDTRLYWKYTRGWKAGHYNALAPPRKDGISVAPPEQIDAFELGLDGAWLHNAL